MSPHTFTHPAVCDAKLTTLPCRSYHAGCTLCLLTYHQSLTINHLLLMTYYSWLTTRDLLPATVGSNVTLRLEYNKSVYSLNLDAISADWSSISAGTLRFSPASSSPHWPDRLLIIRRPCRPIISRPVRGAVQSSAADGREDRHGDEIGRLHSPHPLASQPHHRWREICEVITQPPSQPNCVDTQRSPTVLNISLQTYLQNILFSECVP